MPELPEVETVVRELRPLVVGRMITSLRVGTKHLRQPWQAKWTLRVKSKRIAALQRRGKWILADLDNQTYLLLHLGMTGQLTMHPKREKLADHIHLAFRFDDDNELRFRDVRRFGSAAFFESESDLNGFLNSRLGPEPFGVDHNYFRSKIQSSDRPVKAILLDQTVLAGIGNIYADEACFLARVHPGRRGATLSSAECDRLRSAIETVLARAVEDRGSTIRDYIGGSGLRGNYQDKFAVYGRTGQPCVKCSSMIHRQRIGGRSSHYCLKCQN